MSDSQGQCNNCRGTCILLHVHTCTCTCTVYMLGAKHGFAQSVDCPAQSVDLHFPLAIPGLTHDHAIPGLCTHDEREGQLLATWPAILNDNHL